MHVGTIATTHVSINMSSINSAVKQTASSAKTEALMGP